MRGSVRLRFHLGEQGRYKFLDEMEPYRSSSPSPLARRSKTIYRGIPRDHVPRWAAPSPERGSNWITGEGGRHEAGAGHRQQGGSTKVPRYIEREEVFGQEPTSMARKAGLAAKRRPGLADIFEGQNERCVFIFEPGKVRPGPEGGRARLRFHHKRA